MFMSTEKNPSKSGFFESLKKIDRLMEALKDLQRVREAKKRSRAQDTKRISNAQTKEDASKIVF